MDGSEYSAGKSLIDLGLAESYLDQKRDGHSEIITKSSADSVLLRILTSNSLATFMIS